MTIYATVGYQTPETPPQMNTPKRSDILHEAEQIISGARDKEYGGPESNLKRIAEYWGVFLTNMSNAPDELDPWEVAIMMSLLKIARLQSTNGLHKDSWVDAIGYLANGYEVSEAK